MNIRYKTRDLYPDEVRLLKTLKKQKASEVTGRMTFCYFFIAGLSGIGATYVTSITPDSFWTFLFGTIAVVAFIVFTPYQICKQKNLRKLFLRQLSATLEQGTVDTLIVNAERIAIAPEYEDESDLYIIELNDKEVLYLWDTAYDPNEKFPCLDLEICEGSFFELTGKQIYPLSEKIQPIEIVKKAKWKFMEANGSMGGHLEIEKTNFDELIRKFNHCA